MRKKMYWGITSLILIVGVVGVYYMLQPDPEPEKRYIVPSEAELKKAREAKQPPREAKDGFTWEWHDDHWHEVPIAQQEEKPKPIVSVPKSEKVNNKTYDAPLTYDKDLFETNPVKSLILEMKARGHWGAEYIPDFPPEDLEAQELARYEYIISFMPDLDAKTLWDAILKQRALLRRLDAKYGKFSARAYDLERLCWPSVETPSADWETLVNSPNYPSEFFSNE